MSDTARAAPLVPFRVGRSEPVPAATDRLVAVESLGDRPLPVVIRSAVSGLRFSEWARLNREVIQAHLDRHGGILFRGFPVAGQTEFDQLLDAVGLQRMSYVEGATPRTHIGGTIYTSTEFPSEHVIALHNELSYVMTWPMRIAFCCVTPPDTGGETPIADVRRVYERIPTDIRQTFEARGWMLVRNFGEGLSLTWQQAYRVGDRAQLEQYAAGARLSLEWNGDRLRTRQVRPAVARHPRTGERVWFNHVAFWHVSSLEPSVRRVLLEAFGDEGLPYNTYYGDGSPIEDEVVAALRDAYDAETVAFEWQAKDVLLLDNMLAAHGRRPFTGARRVIVGMGDPYTRDDC